MEADVAVRPATSALVTPLGKPTCGSPLGTGPSVDTPCELRSNPQLTAIAPITATRPPGMNVIQRSNTIRVARTATDTARVAPDVLPRSPRVSQSLISVPLTRL